MEPVHAAENTIEVKNLVKKFGDFTAVNNISFTVREGEIFGLLGKNGAGKTTTISILATIQEKTSGSVSICGTDVSRQDAARRLIGIVFQDQSLDDELTAYDNLDFHARLYGVKKGKREIIEDALKLVELSDRAHKQVKTFSGGMKRRLEIARGLIHRPRVLFLDEPTTGLDPQTRRKIWTYVKDLNREHRMTIILTTHYMEEADLLCDRIAIMDKGNLVRTDTPEALKKIVADKENPTLEDAFICLTGDSIADEEGDPMAEFVKRLKGRSR